MKRGDIVTITLQGDAGKPRPALVFQSDAFIDVNFVIVIPLTSHLSDTPLLKVRIPPSEKNGLQKESEAMMHRITSIAISKIGKVVGSLEHHLLTEIERRIVVILGIA